MYLGETRKYLYGTCMGAPKAIISPDVSITLGSLNLVVPYLPSSLALPIREVSPTHSLRRRVHGISGVYAAGVDVPEHKASNVPAL